MRFTPTPIEGAFVAELEERWDERGCFARAWCADEFGVLGLDTRIVQANLSYSRRKGTLRGLHYQLPPHGEAKTLRCIRGAVYDVLVDLRSASPSYMRWFAVELTATNRKVLFAPAGCAHGHQTLVPHSEILYFVSSRYTAGAERGLRYDDPALGIGWPLPVSAISEKDRAWPDLDDVMGSRFAAQPELVGAGPR